MLACSKNIRDNTPETRPAGKVFAKGYGTKECLVTPPTGRVTPDIVKHMRGVLRPEPGLPWELPQRTGEPPVNPDLSHGIKTASSLKAAHLVNPFPKTRFQQARVDRKEAVYHSSKTKPLGKSHDQSDGLPQGLDASATSFGVKTEKGVSVREMVSPHKTSQQVDKEFEEGRDLYKKSHNDWGIGEIVDRNYDWSKFTKDALYGMETPHDNRGVLVSSALDWRNNVDGRKVIAKRLDDFREKTQHQLASVHDPMVDTLDVPPDHTFGTIVPTDEFNAGDLVQTEGPNTYSECTSLDRGVLASVRNHLKKYKFNNFECFLEALRDKDGEKSGVIPVQVLHDVAFHFRVPLSLSMLEMLARWATREGCVVYEDLVMLMNWNYPLEEERLMLIAQYTADHAPSTSEPDTTLSKLQVSENYMTSSQAYRAVTGDLSTLKYRTFGVPTVRSDLAAPHLKRVSDSKNYGDEADSGTLIYPSIYSNHGVYQEDFFRPYPPEKIRDIFKLIGVEMSTEVFEELWAMAAERDPRGRGEVCVETFRMVAEAVKTHQLLELNTRT